MNSRRKVLIGKIFTVDDGIVIQKVIQITFTIIYSSTVVYFLSLEHLDSF